MSGWALIAGLGLATYALKAVGPLSAGRWRLPHALARHLPYVAPAVLAALVVTATFATEGRLVGDARAAGLAAAVGALALRAPPLLVVVVAAAATAGVRAL